MNQPGAPRPRADWSRDDAVAWLNDRVNLEAQAARRAEGPTLDRIRTLVTAMGDPQHASPVIHVTGTNGKGTTTRLIAALLGAHQLGVGTFTSPHLQRENERIARNLDPIGDRELAEQLRAIADLESLLDGQPSYFEVFAAAAFRWFADVAVDVAVVEVGMAGRWDATNVADGQVAVVTNVGLDHTDYLGDTLEGIAREKAGIVKPGATLVLGETAPPLVEIFEAEPAGAVWHRGREFGCDANAVAVGGRMVTLRTPFGTHDEVYLPLHGAHQGENAAVALAAVEAFFERRVDDDVLAEAWSGLTVPGRFEVVERRPALVLDGAHNPDGARVAAATLTQDFAGVPAAVVLAVQQPHDAAGIVEALCSVPLRGVVVTRAPSVRAVEPDELARLVRAAAGHLPVESVPDLGDAIVRGRALATDDGLVLVTGSLYAVGAARTLLGKRPGGR